MSFESIQNQAEKVIHERSCIMLYQFSPAELKQVQNVARLTGLRDQIILKVSDADNTLRIILDDAERQEAAGGIKEKAIIFNNIPASRMNAFIEALKKYRMSRPLMAVVTEHSINWTISELMRNLQEERSSLSAQKGTAHH